MDTSNLNITWIVNGKPFDGDRMLVKDSQGPTFKRSRLTVLHLSFEDTGPVTCTASDVVNEKPLIDQDTAMLFVTRKFSLPSLHPRMHTL